MASSMCPSDSIKAIVDLNRVTGSTPLVAIKGEWTVDEASNC